MNLSRLSKYLFIIAHRPQAKYFLGPLARLSPQQKCWVGPCFSSYLSTSAVLTPLTLGFPKGCFRRRFSSLPFWIFVSCRWQMPSFSFEDRSSQASKKALLVLGSGLTSVSGSRQNLFCHQLSLHQLSVFEALHECELLISFMNQILQEPFRSHLDSL